MTIIAKFAFKVATFPPYLLCFYSCFTKLHFSYLILTGGWFVIRHASGFGVGPIGGRATNGAQLVLRSKQIARQEYVFVWTAKKSIKHVVSGMCINKRGSSLVLQKGCDTMPSMRFKQVGNVFKSIQKGRKAMYVTAGSSLSPLPGTRLTTRARKTVGAAFQFKSKNVITYVSHTLYRKKREKSNIQGTIESFIIFSSFLQVLTT